MDLLPENQDALNSAQNDDIETRHDRFARLSQSRLSVIKDKLHSLSNLSNRRYYEFSANEVETLFDDIENEVQRAKEKFSKALRHRSPST